MSKTGIEWTDMTWNPVTGCTKVSTGCANCYAERWAKRTFKGRPFSEVHCHPERFDQPLHWRKPRRIFVCSMGDLFNRSVPTEFINKVFAVMALRRHIYQVLTKRPDQMRLYLDSDRRNRMRDWMIHINPLCDWPEWPLSNVWLGVSVEDQETGDERIPLLLQTSAAVRFVSIEPMLAPVVLRPSWFKNNPPQFSQRHIFLGGLDWVIVGGESGPKARPLHPDLVRSVRDQCQAAGVPFFFKGWGEWSEYTQFGADQWKRTDCRNSVVLGKLSRDGEPMFGGRSFPTSYCFSKRGEFESVGPCMVRVGKKLASRMLDGRTWDETPQAKELRK